MVFLINFWSPKLRNSLENNERSLVYFVQKITDRCFLVSARPREHPRLFCQLTQASESGKIHSYQCLFQGHNCLGLIGTET